MPLARQPIYQCSVNPGPLVLGTRPFKLPTPTTDRDQTVSRRFEPSSRTTLIGEQPNPSPTFVPVRLVCLTVKLVYAFALDT